MAALIPLEYCPCIASFNASAQPTRFPRLRAGAPIEFAVLVLAAGFGVGRLCFSTLSASSFSRDCRYSITFLGCFIPLSLTLFMTVFAMALPSTPSMWQLVRIKLISCLVNKQLFIRKASLMCSRASSLDLFTTVLGAPLTMALATVVLLVLTASCQGFGGGGKGGKGGGVGVGEVIRRAPAGALRLAWVRYGSESYLPCSTEFPSPSSSPLSVFSQFPFSFRFLKPYRTSLIFGIPCISVRFA
jgi:hypothetical protein